jgi:adenylate kinase
MNLVLFGPPGAGKGTQSAFLVEKYNMRHISSGDLFRSNIKSKTPLGLEAQKYIDQGKLVPDVVTIGMVRDVMKGLGGKPFILDGFPRNLAQAKALDSMLSELRLSVDKAIFFEVPDSQLVSRLTGRRTCKNCGAVFHVEEMPPKIAGVCDNCGEESLYQRPDDQIEAIKTRLTVYADQTAPLRDYYGSTGKLAPIDGSVEVAEVSKQLSQLVASKR